MYYTISYKKFKKQYGILAACDAACIYIKKSHY